MPKDDFCQVVPLSLACYANILEVHVLQLLECSSIKNNNREGLYLWHENTRMESKKALSC